MPQDKKVFDSIHWPWKVVNYIDYISHKFVFCRIFTKKIPAMKKATLNKLVSVFTDAKMHKEIAEMLNISVGTSKSNLARARMILKEKIEKHKANYNSLIL